jgi:hypothetical protein
MSTNSPESGRSDQSAFAVTWNSTIRPPPLFSNVTSGVPSDSRAQDRSARRGTGSASTCVVTVTSGGGVSPAKGDPSTKGASVCGRSQDSAAPSCRSPARSGTGMRASARSAVRGPAKRRSIPPPATKRVTASTSGPSTSGRSASTSTASRRASRASSVPRRTSAVGLSARSR